MAAKLGCGFLKKYSKSVIANRVRLATAFALLRTEKFDESIRIYKLVVESKEHRLWVKNEATWYLRQVYVEKGDVEEAICCVEKDGHSFSARTNQSF